MKLKKVISLAVSLVMICSSINVSFAGSQAVVNNLGVGDEVTSGQAVEIDNLKPYDSTSGVAYAVEGGNIYFDESTGTIIKCDGTVTAAVIPSKINGIDVTSISTNAFRSCHNLRSITILYGVNSIDDYAFYGCYNLTNIIIPDSVTNIGNYAFVSCNGLTNNITIPDSVTHIGDYAFDGCTRLVEISIPGSVVSIGDYAFNGCWSLKTVNISEGVTTIGTRVFSDCGSLSSITIPESVTSIGTHVFYACDSLKTAGAIGSGCNCEFGWTKEIPANSFSYSSLNSVTIPQSVTNIGNNAFKCCYSLADITIPNSVTNIGDYAFQYCSGLTDIVIPNSVTNIGDYAFDNCRSLTDITMSNSVKNIGDNSFSYCKGLIKITIPNSVTSIGSSVFRGCSSLTSITIPDSVTSISGYAFNGCDKEKLVFYVVENSYADTWAKENGFSTASEIPNGDSTTLKTDSILLNQYNVGDTIPVHVYSSKGDSSDKLEINWTSSDNTVAYAVPELNSIDSVDRYNYKADIVAVSEGSATITATAPNGSYVSFEINVTKKELSLEEVLINGKSTYDIAKPHTGDLIITLKFNDDIVVDKSVSIGNTFSLLNSQGQGKAVQINSDSVTVVDDRTININFGNIEFNETLNVTLPDKPISPKDTSKCVFNRDSIFPVTLKSGDSSKKYNVAIAKTNDLAQMASQYVIALNAFEESTYNGLESFYGALGDNSYNQLKPYIDSMLTKDIDRLPTEAQEACRMALYRALKSVGSTNIELKFNSDPTKLSATILNEIMDKFQPVTVEFDEAGYKYKATATIYAMQGLNVGSVHCELKNNLSESYDVGVSSSNNECSDAVATFMKELGDFGTEAVVNVATTIAGEYAKAFGIDKYINSKISEKLSKYRNEATDGLKELINAYEDGKKIANTIQNLLENPDDPLVMYSTAEELMKMEKDNPFAKTAYTSGSAYGVIKEARNALIEAGVYYVQHNEMPEITPDGVFNWIKETFKCPIDIYVYDENGNEIGSIVNDEITVSSDDIKLEKFGDEKTLYIYNDAKVTYKLVAYDYGMLNVSEEVKTDGFIEKRSNIYDIPLDINDVLTSNVVSKDSTRTITSDNDVYTPDEVLSVDDDGGVIINTSAENGSVYGGGTYVKGDNVSLIATPNDGYVFNGWYVDNKLLDVRTVICFTANNSKTYEAKFVKVELSSEATTEATTEASTEATTEASTEATTEVSTEVTTEATTEASTEATTEATTEVSTEVTTEATTEVSTELTTETTTKTTTETTTSAKRQTGGSGRSSGKGSVAGTTTTEATTETTTQLVDFNEVRVAIGSNTISVDNAEYTIDAAPYIQAYSNSTMVPLRFVAVALLNESVTDADVSSNIIWDAQNKTATILYNGKVIKFTAGSNKVAVDGTETSMEYGVKAEIKDGRMYIPFRALGNSMGVDVAWEAESKTAVYSAK